MPQTVSRRDNQKGVNIKVSAETEDLRKLLVQAKAELLATKQILSMKYQHEQNMIKKYGLNPDVGFGTLAELLQKTNIQTRADKERIAELIEAIKLLWSNALVASGEVHINTPDCDCVGCRSGAMKYIHGFRGGDKE